jgi:hypothetical protein
MHRQAPSPVAVGGNLRVSIRQNMLRCNNQDAYQLRVGTMQHRPAHAGTGFGVGSSAFPAAYPQICRGDLRRTRESVLYLRSEWLYICALCSTGRARGFVGDINVIACALICGRPWEWG